MKTRDWRVMWIVALLLSACGSKGGSHVDVDAGLDTGDDSGSPTNDAGDDDVGTDADPERPDASLDAGPIEPDTGGLEPDTGEPWEGEVRPAFRAVLTPADLGGTTLVDAVARDVNDAGVLVGEATLRGAGGFSNRLAAFRFSEAGGFDDLSGGIQRSSAAAINDAGTIAGTLGSGPNDVAFLYDGNGLARIGEQLATATQTRGHALNAAGQVGGTCVVGGAEFPCRYSPDEGWTVLEQPGTGAAIADDGSLAGYGRTPSRAYVWSDADGLRDVGLADQHKSMVTALSPSGRWIGTVRFVSRLLYPAQSHLIDAAGSTPRQLADGDGRPRRELAAMVKDANDDGWAVGNSYDERGDSVGVLWNPWSGVAYDLNDLVDLEPGQVVTNAEGISANGHVAATIFHAGRTHAALLIPTSFPSPPEESDSVESEGYQARWAQLVPGPRASHAVGVHEDGRLLLVAEDYDNSVYTAYERYGWMAPDGTITLHGERGDDLPVAMSPTGRLVGTATVLDEFTDILRYYAASARDDGGLVHVGTHPSSLDSFGYGISEGDEIVGECLGNDGFFGCYYNPATQWQRLFEGWASDVSDDGVVVGNAADGPVEWSLGAVVSYDLGPEARLLAISPNSVWIVGDRPEGAFLLDRRTEAVIEMPALALHSDRNVEPRFVRDDGVVVGTARNAAGVPVAFRWKAPDEHLTVLVDSDGVRHILSAEMINSRGHIAVTAVDGDRLVSAGILVPTGQ